VGGTGIRKTKELVAGGVNDGKQRKNKVGRQGVDLVAACHGFIGSDVGCIRDVAGELHAAGRLLVAGS